MATDRTNLSYSPWRAPEVVDSRHLRPVDVEAARKLAWEQGYEDGYSIGLEAGMGDARRHMSYLNEILGTLAKPFDDLDAGVASQLAVLVRSVAAVILRREVEIDSSFLADIVRRGIETLPIAAANVRLVVHPDDAALIEDHLDADKADRPWRIEIDPDQPRGGCRLLSDIAQIDSQVETRLEQLVASMLEAGRGDSPKEPYDV
jgi:flagellar assembly protein FliH